VFFMVILPVIDRAMQRGLWRHGKALWGVSQEDLEGSSALIWRAERLRLAS
jgi:hypothetical protein